MKKHALVSFFIILFAMPFLHGQTTAISDLNFEDYLETHDSNGNIVPVGPDNMGDGVENNGFVLNTRIENVITLNVSNLDIINLSGIGGFTSLETLICSNNKLIDLDVSLNANLKTVLCGSNRISNLLLTNNLDLETLNCSNNQLNTLAVAALVSLKSLSCSNNQLISLDVSNNNALNSLNVSNNGITGELVISNNTALESLFCASNQITTLNVNVNTALRNLDASNNLITDLDLSTINTAVCPTPQSNPPTACQGLATINVSQNNLSSLIINNIYNTLISTFNSEDNPDLACIQIDTGFTPPASGVLAWIKDDWTYYSENVCTDIYTYVPDDNFENHLETHDINGAVVGIGAANSMGDGVANNNLVLTARISSTVTLSVSSLNIADLTGIEDFLDLEDLNCSSNDLKELDLNNNVKLTKIDCSDNILPTLNLSSHTVLEDLNCSVQRPFVDVDDASKNYTFDSLKVESNTALLILNCSNNAITLLDISSNVLLSDLDCSFNQINRLDASANNTLTTFNCDNNQLTALNLKNVDYVLLPVIDVTSNVNLSCIEVDDVLVPAGWSTDLGVTYSLNCGTYVPDNNFESYLETHRPDKTPVLLGDLTSMGDGQLNNFVPTAKINALTELDINNENVADITGIEDFVALLNLNCSNNLLTSLDLKNNTALTTIDCAFNQIENLDFSLNAALTDLLCNNNELYSLSVKNGNNVNLASFDARVNNQLFCIEIDDENNIDPSWLKDAIASFREDCDGSRFTLIPDPFFEQALIDLGLDSGAIDGQVLTSNIEHVLSLDVSDKLIESLEGIKDFALLKELECSGNYLSRLDLSGMANLEFLNCNSNYFLTNDAIDPNAPGLLNTTGTVNLRRLFCASNSLGDLNVSTNLNLEELDCTNNDLNALNVTANTNLKVLNCANNELTGLDLSLNAVLEDVNCTNNQILTLTQAAVNNSTLKNLSCSNNSLATLLLDNYAALESLSCRNNQIPGLDLTSNPALKTLDCTNNKITGIDLVNNTNLLSLLCSQNDLTQLDLNTNVVLKTLNCSSNNITNLVLDTNILLKYLSCSDNQLSVLNVSNNSNLVELNLSSNSITSLTLPSDISTLKTLNASINQIVGNLDLSTIGTAACPPVSTDPNNPQDFCPTSISIDLSQNALEFVNLKNGINSEISNFNTLNNPNLSCIEVDDVNAIGVSWIKDATTEYRLDCRFGETYVPDDNFELALIALGYDSLPLDDYVLTSEIDVLISLDVSGENIADLTGIEDFIALEVLNCSDNALTDLDLNKNVVLITIDCSSNTFSEIDFSANIALTTIDCSNNTLTNLDLTANSNLINLNISNNSFSTFLPSNIPSLEDFNCDSNQLTDLDLSSNSALTVLSCESNVLEVLNLKNGQNASLATLNAQNNPNLTCIVTDTGDAPSGVTWLKDATAEYEIDCHYGQTYVPDDAFEQALIDKGLDLGVLDDYVPTDRINNISSLDVNNNTIEDLTGIEDFVSLENLNFSNNAVLNVDLSENVLLEELNASNNGLTEIDLSFNINLEVANTSGNSLAEIDLDSNINLLELNISNNQLTVLNVEALVSLQELDCSLNVLENLSVELNSQLINLYCQSNRFISDQLNLQNGANANLANFNATDNGDLKCILVDDPFTIITNAGGVYDDWFKDFTSNYQSVCIDADNDGVNNEDDLCPNSVFGQPVDLFGCEYLILPNNNFTVLITGETCLNSNNGKINITATDIFNYTATVTSDDFEEPFSIEYKFTNDVEIRNLLAGIYQMCITIEEWPDYISCYDVVINHPEELAVLTNKSNGSKKVSLELSGNSNYNIDVNGLTFTTNTNAVTLNLKEGANSIKVSTDLECQGVYEEHIFVSNELFVYPNPFNDQIKVYLGDIEGDATVNIHSSLGQLVYSKTFVKQENQNLNIDTYALSVGLYSISIKTKASLSTFKIVKK